ncbi:MAG: hypothetical protein ACI4VD_06770 [Limosilactobacillus mucosae]
MKRVLALIFMMALAVSFSFCANSSQDVEVVPRQNEDVQTDEASLMPDTEKETAEDFLPNALT